MATSELYGEHSDIDCIFYANDDLALGGLFFAMSQGIDVPGELALMGFNGSGVGKATPLPLSTIDTPRYEIGAKAAQLFLEPQTTKKRRLDLSFGIFEGRTTQQIGVGLPHPKKRVAK